MLFNTLTSFLLLYLEFWGDFAKDFFWKTKHAGKFLDYNFDVTKGDIYVKCMEGASTNICYNVLDRNVHERKLGDKVAFYWLVFINLVLGRFSLNGSRACFLVKTTWKFCLLSCCLGWSFWVELLGCYYIYMTNETTCWQAQVCINGINLDSPAILVKHRSLNQVPFIACILTFICSSSSFLWLILSVLDGAYRSRVHIFTFIASHCLLAFRFTKIACMHFTCNRFDGRLPVLIFHNARLAILKFLIFRRCFNTSCVAGFLLK